MINWRVEIICEIYRYFALLRFLAIEAFKIVLFSNRYFVIFLSFNSLVLDIKISIKKLFVVRRVSEYAAKVFDVYCSVDGILRIIALLSYEYLSYRSCPLRICH